MRLLSIQIAEQAIRAVRIFYDLSDSVTNGRWNAGRRVYEVPAEPMDDLKGFLADFHDDNESFWNLLSDEQRRR